MSDFVFLMSEVGGGLWRVWDDRLGDYGDDDGGEVFDKEEEVLGGDGIEFGEVDNEIGEG